MPTKKPATKKPVAKKAAAKKAVKTVAKKVTKKPAAKKVMTKATTKKKVAAKKVDIKKPVKDLIYASDQESFWTADGEILNSLIALRDALAKMDKDIYQFHAAGEQNDFSVWVDTVLQDQECADDLCEATTPAKAKTTVVRYLKLYSI